MNDERPIEKLLRRAAQKRRGEIGAPPELHPANRRLLQAEVARQFPKTEPAAATAPAASRESFWALLTQRWGFVLGFFVILGIAAAVILPLFDKKEGNFELTKLSYDDERFVSRSSEPAAAPAPLAMSDLAETIPSGGGNFAPPPQSAPATTTTAELTSARRELVAAPASSRLALPEKQSDAVSRSAFVSSGVSEVESLEKEKVDGDVAAERFSRVATASTASRPQLAKSAETSPGVAESNRPSSETPVVAPTSRSVAFGSRRTNQIEAEQGGLRSAAVDDFAAGANNESIRDSSVLPRGGGLETDLKVINSQSFSNISREVLARRRDAREFRALPPTALTKFQVQQQGSIVQVIDSDGSIYKGFVDEANTLYKQISAEKERQLTQSFDNRARFQSPKAVDAVAPTTQKQSTAQRYLYRVEGTNRTINQNVVFTWNFIPTNDAVAAVQSEFNQNLLKPEADRVPSPFPMLLQNSYIDGRAVIGSNRQVEVNAVPIELK